MKRDMFRLFALSCLTCTFLFFSGCVNERNDSGAYNAAMEAYENGNYDKALVQFKNAAENDGRKAEAYRGIGMVYLQQGNYEAAVNMFDLSISEMGYNNDDFEEDVMFYKAEALEKSERTDEALEIYQELEGGENAALAYALEGRIYLNNSDTQTASEKFSASIESGENIKICLIIYEAYRDVNLEGYGADYLERAVEIEPETGEEYALIGKAYYYLDDYSAACTSLNRAISEGYSDAVSILGNVYLEEGDISSAKSLYTGLLENEEDMALAYNGLVLCSIAEGSYDTALSYIEEGLKCNNIQVNRSLLFNEIVVYEKMLDFDTAAKKAEEYINIYPSDEKIINELKFLSHS